MTLEHDKDDHAITMFVLRYEAKLSAEAKAGYLKRLTRIMKEERVDMPLMPKSLVDKLYATIEESIAQTDKCLKMLDKVEFRTEAEADQIIPTT